MKLIRLFVLRPVGTSLIALTLLLGGIMGYLSLPVADLPNIDFPVIMVTANQPGGSPSEIASTIAEPLERHLGAIAGIREITSETTINQTRILLQFDLSRNINGAARDVQAAILAARQDLPSTLRTNPNFIKANSNGPPIMEFTLVSSTHTPQQLYDFASNILTPSLSQVEGVSNVDIHGSALPAVRVEINPLRLFHYGIGFEDIRAALASANAHTPKGFITLHGQTLTLATNDQATKAKAYARLVIAYRNNQPVRLSDVAEIHDSTEDLRQAAYINGKPDIICYVFAQSRANIIKTTDALKARLPELREALPSNTQLDIRLDRSTTIRASLADTQKTLIITIFLVVLVMLLFLQNLTSTLIPAIVVPISIITTFGAMKLLNYQLDTMSLMALTIATGFVMDDAIVVLENITRYLEMGYQPQEAAIKGTSEVAFTVLSITVSLIAVFIPVLLMEGISGIFFHEFAMTMVIALLVSLFLSLSLTPMMSALFLHPYHLKAKNNARYFWNYYTDKLNNVLKSLNKAYEQSLDWALDHPRLILLSLPLTIISALILFTTLPKELFPQRDEDILMGRIVANQSISFHALQNLTQQAEERIARDPDVISVTGGLGKRSSNSVNLLITLKTHNKRKDDISITIQRLNRLFLHLANITVRLHMPGLIGAGTRSTDGAYQYTLQSNSSEELYTWTPRVIKALSRLPVICDVTSDIEQNGSNITFFINRDQEARYAITPQLTSNALYDAFGQRSASIIYGPLNQYRVIMEADPKFWADPFFLNQMWISTAGGTANGGTISNNLRVRATTNRSTISQSQLSYQNAMANALAGRKSASSGAAVATTRETMVPLRNLGELKATNTPLTVNHQGQFVATTISFNLAPHTALGSAINAVQATLVSLHLPKSIQGNFSGNAATLQKTTSQEPLLILIALATVYIVLGILYESLIHPITILSTLPSAGVGALCAVMLFHEHFSLLTFIGIILLIGIVKKNAIMLVDFAIIAQAKGNTPREAIRTASLLRFRPIIMTSIAAALGAIPMLISNGYSSEMRQPLGLSILGGLCLSQLLTLYTTPIVYLFLDNLKTQLLHNLHHGWCYLKSFFLP